MPQPAIVACLVALALALLIIAIRRRRLPDDLGINHKQLLYAAYLGNAKVHRLSEDHWQSYLNDLTRARLIYVDEDYENVEEYVPTRRGLRYIKRYRGA